MIKQIFTLVTLFFLLEGYAQFQPGDSYPKAKLYIKDHGILKVDQLKITEAELIYFDMAKNQQRKPISELEFIKAPKGNHLLEGAGFGAATMALASLLIDLDTDALGRPQEKDAGFYLAMTGGGILVGGLIGVLVPKWKSLYPGSNTIGSNQQLQFGIFSGQAYTGINMKLKL